MMVMGRIRLRVRRGYRADVVEVALRDVLVGSGPGCDVIVDGVAERHARLLPRRGRLLLAPAPRTPRRPAVFGSRVDAPVVLGPDQPFQLADVEVRAEVVSTEETLVGRMVGPYRAHREIGSEHLGQRIYRAESPNGPARLHQAVRTEMAPRFLAVLDGYEVGAQVVWAETGAPAVALNGLLAAHRRGAVRWPVQAGVVLVTQLAEAVCDFHNRVGPHGALRPELVFIDTSGRVSLGFPAATDRSWTFQPEAVRLGQAPDIASDLFGWWRLTHAILSVFADASLVRPLLARPPTDRAELLAAAEGVRRWAVDRGLDPTAMHLRRGVEVAVRAPPLVRPGPETSGENRAERR